MDLDTFRTVLDIFFLLVALPFAGFKVWRKLDQRLTAHYTKLSKIEYALFNEGRGMEAQLKEVHRNQNLMITDLAVLKAQNA